MTENTRDLSEFGFRELDMAADLLKAYANGKGPDDFEPSGVAVEFNPNSGNVFLVNDEYQVAMLNGDGELESWYYTPYSGYEGFLDDLLDEADDSWEQEDIEYLIDICENLGRDEDAENLRALIENETEEEE